MPCANYEGLAGTGYLQRGPSPVITGTRLELLVLILQRRPNDPPLTVRKLMRMLGHSNFNAVVTHLRALRQLGLVDWEGNATIHATCRFISVEELP
jgi:hypothetical protein